MTLDGTWPAAKINAPELFADPEFMAWLNDPERNQATWHLKGKGANEYSDIFMTVDCGSGSDEDMPEHCWEQLLNFLIEQHVVLPTSGSCLVWLTNLGAGVNVSKDTIDANDSSS